MLQKTLITLIICGVSLGSAGAAQLSQPHAAKSLQGSAAPMLREAPRNATPLPAGGAAGIQQAQGAGENDWLLIGGGIVVAAGILLLVAGGGGDDDPSPPTTTGN